MGVGRSVSNRSSVVEVMKHLIVQDKTKHLCKICNEVSFSSSAHACQMLSLRGEEAQEVLQSSLFVRHKIDIGFSSSKSQGKKRSRVVSNLTQERRDEIDYSILQLFLTCWNHDPECQ
jgi:hypothetical protein